MLKSDSDQAPVFKLWFLHNRVEILRDYVYEFSNICHFKIFKLASLSSLDKLIV